MVFLMKTLAHNLVAHVLTSFLSPPLPPSDLQISVTLQNHTATAYEVRNQIVNWSGSLSLLYNWQLFLVQLIQSCSSFTNVNISSFFSPIHVSSTSLSLASYVD